MPLWLGRPGYIVDRHTNIIVGGLMARSRSGAAVA